MLTSDEPSRTTTAIRSARKRANCDAAAMKLSDLLLKGWSHRTRLLYRKQTIKPRTSCSRDTRLHQVRASTQILTFGAALCEGITILTDHHQPLLDHLPYSCKPNLSATQPAALPANPTCSQHQAPYLHPSPSRSPASNLPAQSSHARRTQVAPRAQASAAHTL